MAEPTGTIQHCNATPALPKDMFGGTGEGSGE
jgi:hypothetical protein